jgi:hypothetical protein
VVALPPDDENSEKDPARLVLPIQSGLAARKVGDHKGCPYSAMTFVDAPILQMAGAIQPVPAI